MPHKKLADSIRLFSGFTRGSAEVILHGNRAYWAWLAFLGALIASGALAWSRQLQLGLGLTAMRDQVSWGFYIGNFTFLVGVAAAAVVLVVPAYIYNWKPIREIVIYGAQGNRLLFRMIVPFQGQDVMLYVVPAGPGRVRLSDRPLP